MRLGLSIACVLSLVVGTAAAQPSLPAAQPSLKAKVFTFPEIQNGACTMPAGSTLTLYSNGMGEWRTETMSNAAAPEVFHITLYIEAGNATTLFYSGGFQSPPMAGGQTYPWSGTLRYDAGLFPLAVHARAWTSC